MRLPGSDRLRPAIRHAGRMRNGGRWLSRQDKFLFPLVRPHGMRNGTGNPVTQLRHSSVCMGMAHTYGDQAR